MAREMRKIDFGGRDQLLWGDSIEESLRIGRHGILEWYRGVCWEK